MRILLWHVHGAWTTAFVQGAHEYVVPITADRGPDGLGRAQTYEWPDTVQEIPLEHIRDERFDAVIYQRPHELELLPLNGANAFYVEHNAPQGRIAEMRHPAADRDEVDLVVHVTHFNDLFWDCGATPTRVVEHGIVDPGLRYTGELASAAVCVNEPVRRGRVTGTDLLPRFAAAVPLDVFGMGTDGLGEHLGCPGVRTVGDLPQHRMHDEMARRRVYLHPLRWTSLGLSLLEAMHLGMPVVALATTEAHEAVPPGAGICSTDVERLVRELRTLRAEPERARTVGAAGRAHVLERYGLEKFLTGWDDVLDRCLQMHDRRTPAGLRGR